MKLIPDALECTPRDVFVAQSYNVPALLARYVGASQVDLYPIQLHSFWFSVFASFVSPFGGFYASAIKRTYGLKDFDSVIPGHGGVMDRMDCQFITALFTTVYYNTFIRCVRLSSPSPDPWRTNAAPLRVGPRSSQSPSIAMILNLAAQLTVADQKELLQGLQELLQSGGA